MGSLDNKQNMTEIRPSSIHGSGVFATRDYLAGSVVVSNLYISNIQHSINASAVLDEIPDNASYADFFWAITAYNIGALTKANVTRVERYDHEFQVQSSELIALVDIKKDEELLDMYPALVWLKKQGQSVNADRYIYHLFRKGHPFLAPSAGVQQQVAANYAARAFSNVIYLHATKENNVLCAQLVKPFLSQYLRRLAQ